MMLQKKALIQKPKSFDRVRVVIVLTWKAKTMIKFTSFNSNKIDHSLLKRSKRVFKRKTMKV